jgi:hypothetical protein
MIKFVLRRPVPLKINPYQFDHVTLKYSPKKMVSFAIKSPTEDHSKQLHNGTTTLDSDSGMEEGQVMSHVNGYPKPVCRYSTT